MIFLIKGTSKNLFFYLKKWVLTLFVPLGRRQNGVFKGGLNINQKLVANHRKFHIATFVLSLFISFNYTFKLHAQDSVETPSRSGMLSGGLILDRAFHYYYEGDLEKSIQLFQKYIEMEGESEVPLRYLGKIHLQFGEFAKAESYLQKTLTLDPKNMEALSLLAQIYINNDNLDKAIPIYEKIIELDPVNEDALYTMAQIYYNKQDYRKSVVYYKKLVLSSSNNGLNPPLLKKAYLNIASYYYNQQDFNLALQYYKEIILLYPEDAQANYIIAELYKLNGDFFSSANILVKLIPYLNEPISALESLIESLLILDDYRLKSYLDSYYRTAETKTEMMTATHALLYNDYKLAAELFEKILLENPGRIAAHVGLQNVFSHTGSYNEKKEAFSVAILAQKLEAYPLASKHLNTVFQLLDKEAANIDFAKHYRMFKIPIDFDEEKAEKIKHIGLDYIELYLTHAMNMEKQNHHTIAIAYYKAALEMISSGNKWLTFLQEKDPKNFEPIENRRASIREKQYNGLLNLSWILFNTNSKSKTEPVSLLNECISLFPNDSRAYFMSGLIAYQKGEKNKALYEKAKTEFSRAIDLFTKTPEESVAPANYYFYLGAVQEKLNQFEETRVNIEKAISIEPYNPVYLNYLGYMFSLKDQDLSKAYEYINRALEDDPENEAYLDTLGWIFFKMKKYEEGLGQLLVAKSQLDKKKIQDSVITFHIAETYYMLSNKGLALMYYKLCKENINSASEKLDADYIDLRIKELSSD